MLMTRRYEEESDRLREVTYRAMTYIDTLRVLFRGQARRIIQLAKEVKILRAFLMVSGRHLYTVFL